MSWLLRGPTSMMGRPKVIQIRKKEAAKKVKEKEDKKRNDTA